MFSEYKDEAPGGLLINSSMIMQAIGYLVILSYCLYTLILICRRKETRRNLFLIGTIISFTVSAFLYLTDLCLYLEEKHLPNKLRNEIIIPRITGDWIF